MKQNDNMRLARENESTSVLRTPLGVKGRKNVECSGTILAKGAVSADKIGNMLVVGKTNGQEIGRTLRDVSSLYDVAGNRLVVKADKLSFGGEEFNACDRTEKRLSQLKLNKNVDSEQIEFGFVGKNGDEVHQREDGVGDEEREINDGFNDNRYLKQVNEDDEDNLSNIDDFYYNKEKCCDLHHDNQLLIDYVESKDKLLKASYDFKFIKEDPLIKFENDDDSAFSQKNQFQSKFTTNFFENIKFDYIIPAELKIKEKIKEFNKNITFPTDFINEYNNN